MNKYTVLWTLVVVLAVLNLTTVGAILYQNRVQDQTEESILVEPDATPITGRYFRQSVGFNMEQMQVYRTSNRRFRTRANDIIREIGVQKLGLFTGLNVEYPDTAQLHATSVKIGNLHSELKQETVRFYLDLYKICSPEQKQKLQSVFSGLFKEAPMVGCGRNKKLYYE